MIILSSQSQTWILLGSCSVTTEWATITDWHAVVVRRNAAQLSSNLEPHNYICRRPSAPIPQIHAKTLQKWNLHSCAPSLKSDRWRECKAGFPSNATHATAASVLAFWPLRQLHSLRTLRWMETMLKSKTGLQKELHRKRAIMSTPHALQWVTKSVTGKDKKLS